MREKCAFFFAFPFNSTPGKLFKHKLVIIQYQHSVRKKQLPTCPTAVKFAGGQADSLGRMPLGQAEIPENIFFISFLKTCRYKFINN